LLWYLHQRFRLQFTRNLLKRFHSINIAVSLSVGLTRTWAFVGSQP
jgi:hypothetical protein